MCYLFGKVVLDFRNLEYNIPFTDNDRYRVGFGLSKDVFPWRLESFTTNMVWGTAFVLEPITDKFQGSVVRLTPTELSFNTAAAWTDIYGHRIGRQDLSRDPIHVGSVKPITGVTTITMSDNENHARQKKALSYGFSKKALREQEDIIHEFVDKLMVNFHDFAARKETFDIVNWLNFFTYVT